MQGAQVQSLAGKLQSRMLQVQKRKGNFKKEEEEKERKKKKLSLESRTLQTRTHTPSLPTLILGVWHGCREHISKASLSLSLFFPFFPTLFFLFIYLFFKITQSCPTLCDPTDYAVHGILQARILEWVAVPFSRGSSPPRN